MAVSGGVCSRLQLDLDVGRLAFWGNDSQSESDPITLESGMTLGINAKVKGCGQGLVLELLPRCLHDSSEALAHLGYPIWVFKKDRS